MEETFKDEHYLMLPLFDELRNEEQLTDVVIITNDGTRFLCHKIILMAGCPFFRGLFRSEMIETRQSEVFLKQIDISGSDFNTILKFIYTGEITLNFENAKAINIYSGLFSMNNLKTLSEHFLIKNISNETCLELWRHSDKYLCDNLKKTCLLSASTQLFLDANINDLTLEEIKSVASLQERNCTSKTLIENIVKWIKVDFETRQQYITDLMELINFDDIEDREFKNQIFADEILMQNKEFLTLTVKYLIKQSAINVSKKKLFVMIVPSIYYTDFDNKNFVKNRLSLPNLYGCATSHTTNGFIRTGGYKNTSNIVSSYELYGPGSISTGGYKNTSNIVSSCELYCPTTGTKGYVPALMKARSNHKSYTLGSKIYACAGRETNTVEFYDEISDKWIYGPAMSTNLFDFGSADDNENSLYAVFGRTTTENYSGSIIHLDTRTKSWQKIYTDPLKKLGCTQSLLKDNHIYSFGTTEGFIFDIRAKKKLSTVQYKLNESHPFTILERFYNCTMVDNDIWLLGSLIMRQEYDGYTIKLNLRTNQWERQMFNDIFDDVSEGKLDLVWCN